MVPLLPENREHALPWKVEPWVISFWENWGDDSHATGFSIPGRSDAPNSRCLWQFRTQNHYLRFCGERVIAVMSPFCLHFGRKRTRHPSSAHTFSYIKPAIFSLTLAEPMFNFSAVAVRDFFFFNQLVACLTVHIVMCGDRPSRAQLVVRFQIVATIPWISHPKTDSTSVHSIFTMNSQ